MSNEIIIKRLIILADEYDSEKKVELLKWLQDLINRSENNE